MRIRIFHWTEDFFLNCCFYVFLPPCNISSSNKRNKFRILICSSTEFWQIKFFLTKPDFCFKKPVNTSIQWGIENRGVRMTWRLFLFWGPLKHTGPNRGGKDDRETETIIDKIGNHACDYRSCSDSNGSTGKQFEMGIFLQQCRVRFFYDPDTVFKSAEDIVRVWWKEDFKTKEVLRSRGFTGSEYEKAAYQINVSEINCKKKEVCRKMFMICAAEGENILCNIHRRKSDEWVPVQQIPPLGVLYWKVCR